MVKQTPARFWINNVTQKEAHLAIEAGASSCTQNPSYAWKMLPDPTDSAHAQELLKEFMAKTANDKVVVVVLQRALVGEIAAIFRPMYEASGGARGLQHYTEMVGCKCAITINWIGTADKLIEQDPPVARFRNSFEKSWKSTLALIASRR